MTNASRVWSTAPHFVRPAGGRRILHRSGRGYDVAAVFREVQCTVMTTTHTDHHLSQLDQPVKDVVVLPSAAGDTVGSGNINNGN